MYIHLKEDKDSKPRSISGNFYKYLEDSNNVEWLVISRYIVYDGNGSKLKDYSLDDKRNITVSLENVQTVEITYDKASSRIQRKSTVFRRLMNKRDDKQVPPDENTS